MADVLIKQVRSAAGSNPRQRDTLRTLRLGRIGKSVVREDNEDLHGLLRKVEHLVTVEPAATAGKGS
jgi:large subunit ribosomal protein L30